MASLLRAAIAGIAIAVVCAIVVSARGPAPREIRLVARDMSYPRDAQPGPNPPLRVRPRETIRVVLQNDDSGMRHDFTIPDWDVQTPVVRAGATAAVVFRAPARGVALYSCTPHAGVMKGTITVE